MRKHLANVALIFIACSVFVWSVWQHELLFFPYFASSWNDPFAFFLAGSAFSITTTRGVAYDLTLLLEFICFILVFIGLWFWQD